MEKVVIKEFGSDIIIRTAELRASDLFSSNAITHKMISVQCQSAPTGTYPTSCHAYSGASKLFLQILKKFDGIAFVEFDDYSFLVTMLTENEEKEVKDDVNSKVFPSFRKAIFYSMEEDCRWWGAIGNTPLFMKKKH